MKYILPILIIYFLCLNVLAYGQQTPSKLTVTGQVISFLDKHPLVGVNVMISGTYSGVITELDGSFALELAPADTLIFSYVGYETLSVPIEGRTYLQVSLVEDINMLMEVEVFSTGYEELPKERVTGSFAGVNNELINRSVAPDIVSRLEGVTPALLVDSRSGSDKISIRGRATIFGNSDPLIVVDNFPYDGDINNLNPNDIERVTVLKDAAAASIWGVRAGNGVIVITTKKGMRRDGIKVGFNANVTLGQKPDLFYAPQMSSAEFIGVERFLFDQGYDDNDLGNNYQFPAVSPVVELLAQHRDGILSSSELDKELELLGRQDVRHELTDQFYRESLRQQYALNLSGGTERHTWYIAGGYDRELMSKQGNQQDRINLSTRQSLTLLPGLELDLGLTYTQRNTERNRALVGLMAGQGIYPYASLIDASGNSLPLVRDYRMGFVDTVSSIGLLDWHYRPIDELELTDNSTTLTDVRASIGLKYTLLDGLSLGVNYQYEKQASDHRVLYDEESYFVRDLVNSYATINGAEVAFNIPTGSILDKSAGSLISNNLRFQVDYALSRDQHELTALAGIDIREVTSDGFSNRYYGYNPNTGLSEGVSYQTYYQHYPSGTWGLIPRVDNITGTVDRFRSYFANAAYTYDHRYTLTLSGRIDQSNLFGLKTNQRSVPLWSAGFKWNLDREGFYNIDWLPLLSLRTTYGFNGNLDNAVTAYTTMRYAADILTGRQRAEIIAPPNDELRWEKTGMWNIGLDFALVNDRISGSVEYYTKVGTDLIGNSPLDPTVGISSYRGNVADMVGQGVDIVLDALVIDRALSWRSNLLFSYTTDKVTEYKEIPTTVNAYFQDASLSGYSFDISPAEGKPLFGIYSYPWAGLDPDTGDPRGYLGGEPSAEYAEIISTATFDSLVYHGPALPPYFGSFRNTISYKGFSLSCNITWKLGHYFRRPSINYSSLYSSWYGHSDYAGRWQEPGDELQTEIPSRVYPANSSRDTFYQHAAVLVEKADHIRLQDIRLSYDFRGGNTFSQLQLYAYVRNLGLLWKANDHGIDPDYNINRSVQTGSIVYPQPLSFSIGIKAEF